jgi:hypothetical protein
MTSAAKLLSADSSNLLLLGLASSRDYAETATISGLLDQLLSKLRQSKTDLQNRVTSTTAASTAAASAKAAKCELSAALKTEVSSNTDLFSNAQTVLKDRQIALDAANAAATKASKEYTAAKSAFDSEMISLTKMKAFLSGGLSCASSFP